MKDIFDFFNNFTENEITLKELSSKVNIEISILIALFSDNSIFKDREDFFNQFSVIKDYFDENGNVRQKTPEDILSYFSNEGEKPIPHKIINRYPLDEYRKLDLFIGKHIFGFDPTKGETEDNDGGFYQAAWIVEPFVEYEIPFYTKESMEKIIKHFPRLKWKITCSNSLFKVIITTKQKETYSAESNSLNISIGKALKEYIIRTKESRFLIQSKLKYNTFFLPEGHEYHSKQEAQLKMEQLSKNKNNNKEYRLIEFLIDGSFIVIDKT